MGGRMGKTVCIGFILLFWGISMECRAQTVKISQAEWRLDLLFDEVEAQTGKLTLFSNDELDVYRTVELEIRDYALEELYAYLLRDTELEFAVLDDYVVIRPRTGEKEVTMRRVSSSSRSPSRMVFLIGLMRVTNMGLPRGRKA